MDRLPIHRFAREPRFARNDEANELSTRRANQSEACVRFLEQTEPRFLETFEIALHERRRHAMQFERVVAFAQLLGLVEIIDGRLIEASLKTAQHLANCPS